MLFQEFIKKNKKLIKFTVSGGTVAFIEFGLLYFLTEKVGLWYLLSAGISFSVAFFVSFTLQKFWTFKDFCREKIYKQLSMYLAVGLFNLCLNQSLLFILVEYFHAWYLIAQVGIAGFLGVGSFILYKFVIFRRINDTCGDNKHILIASGIFPPDLGGPATFALSLAENLAKAKCKVRVIIFGNKQKSTDLYKVIRVNRKMNKLMRYLKYFLQLWRYANQSDVIYAMDMISVGFPSAIVKILDKRIKFFVRLGGDHQWESYLSSGGEGVTMEEYYRRGVFSKKEETIYKINNFVLSKADKIIFNSEYLKSIFLQNKRIDESKAVVIKNISPFPLLELKTKLKDVDNFRFIYAGRLTVVKNLSRFLQAFKMVAETTNKKIIFEMIGDGPDKEKLESEIEKLGLVGMVKIKPRMGREDLMSEISISDVVVVPSLTEFNSNLVSEGLSLGKKVILTNKSEHYYIKDKNKLIYYVDPLNVTDIASKINETLVQTEELSKQFIPSDESWGIGRVINEHIKIFNE